MPLDMHALALECQPRLYRAALVLCGSPWDADDLVQEVFVVAARQGDRFEGRSRPYTWLYGVLLNLDRRARRRQGMIRRKLRVLWGNETAETTSPAAEVSLEVAEWKRSLWSEVSQLPHGQRQALVLRFSEQLSYEEIAEILDCPLGTVKSRIFQGLSALRSQVGSRWSAVRDVPDRPQEDWNHAV